jgi:hypothetical protein
MFKSYHGEVTPELHAKAKQYVTCVGPVRRGIVGQLLRWTRELLRESTVEVGRFERGAARTVGAVRAGRHEAVDSTQTTAALSTVVRTAKLEASGVVRREGRCEGRVLAAVSHAGKGVDHRRRVWGRQRRLHAKLTREYDVSKVPQELLTR